MWAIEMYQPPIVNFPVFSVTWSKSTGADGESTPAVLTAGGGGAGNTGVGNKIVSIHATEYGCGGLTSRLCVAWVESGPQLSIGGVERGR